MAGNSYIQVINDATGSSQTGRKLYLNIEPVARSKGVPTSDIPIPSLSPNERLLIPTGGNQDNFTLNIVLIEENSKVCADISSSGSESDSGERSIKEQWDFLFDEIMEVSYEGGIFAEYLLYLDWNQQTYTGWLQAQSEIDNEEFTGRVECRLIFKRGKNPLTTLV